MVIRILPGHKRRKTKITRRRIKNGVVVSFKAASHLRKKKQAQHALSKS